MCPLPFLRSLTFAMLAMSLCVVCIGCGSERAAASHPTLVAAEATWGDIAAQLTGGTPATISILDSPAQDPHTYEPVAQDARAIADAAIVIVNGLGYDTWASQLLDGNGTPATDIINVGSTLHLPDGANPHRWYSPDDVTRIINRITQILIAHWPNYAGQYRARHDQYLRVGLGPYHHIISAIRARYHGSAIGISESVFVPMANALGLVVATPPALTRSVSEGTDISPADLTTAARQITGHTICVWVENVQNPTPAVNHLTNLARTNGIPVVAVTETPSPHGVSFAQWQTTQLIALNDALSHHTQLCDGSRGR